MPPEPDGTLLNSAAAYYCNVTSIELSSVMLPQNGYYTVLVGDCSDTNTGKYISPQCFGNVQSDAERTSQENSHARLALGQC